MIIALNSLRSNTLKCLLKLGNLDCSYEPKIMALYKTRNMGEELTENGSGWDVEKGKGIF